MESPASQCGLHCEAARPGWDEVRDDSVLLISASEGKPPISTAAPERYVGDAVFTVLNIARYDGGVEFGVSINWDDPLDLWTRLIEPSRCMLRRAFRECRLSARAPHKVTQRGPALAFTYRTQSPSDVPRTAAA